MMTSVSEVANLERTARLVLSMLIEPKDPVTGRILSMLGAVETLWLAERDGAVVGLSPVDAQVWKAGQAPSSHTPPSMPRPTSPQKQNCPAIRRGKFRFSHLTWS
ncbi:hypothetical protein [uncultured Arsenicicoccus sp.]|uniref:hypothetical protein n=1 Tax=uncultured Arsenicicoccus sp. TaxID=491339 RepID=UPI00259393A5|nr:hypothetical protein [uncultured Arsenicicoccus sp.]